MSLRARALRLIEEVNFSNKLRNHYRNRITKYKNKVLKQVVFKLENLKAEQTLVKTQRSVYHYSPVQVKLEINVYQERNLMPNQANRYAEHFTHDGILFAKAKTVSIVIPKRLYDNLELEEIDGKNFVTANDELLDLLSASSNHVAGINSIKNACLSGTCLLELGAALPVPAKNAAFRNPRTVPLRGVQSSLEAWIEPKLTNKLITYESNPGAKFFSEMFRQNKFYCDGGCMYTAVMNVWSEDHNAAWDKIKNKSDARVKPRLTFEWIFKTIYPVVKFPGLERLHEFPLTFNDLVKIAKIFKTTVRAYDYRGNLIAEDGDPTPTHKLKILCILIHGDHAFLIDDEKKKEMLKKRDDNRAASKECEFDETMPEPTEPENYCSYSMARDDPPPYTNTISSVSDLFDTDKVLNAVRKDIKERIKFLWTKSLPDLANWIKDVYIEKKFLPTVRSNENGMIHAVYYQVPTAKGQVLVEISSPDYGMYFNDDPEATIKKVKAVTAAQMSLRRCHTPELKSFFNPVM